MGDLEWIFRRSYGFLDQRDSVRHYLFLHEAQQRRLNVSERPRGLGQTSGVYPTVCLVVERIRRAKLFLQSLFSPNTRAGKGGFPARSPSTPTSHRFDPSVVSYNYRLRSLARGTVPEGPHRSTFGILDPGARRLV